MLQLTYSNRTEILLTRLADRIREEWARGDGAGRWDPSLVVVPNPHMKAYVRAGLSRELGVATNLRFLYLNGLWRELLRSDTYQVLGSDLLRIGTLQALHDRSFLDQPELAPVRHYLQGDANGLRTVQLATELARLFEEYQYSRPGWIRKWREGKGANVPESPTEVWQRMVWLRAVSHLDASGMTHLTLDEALQRSVLTTARLPRIIHAFGLSHVAQVYHEVYTKVGQLPDTELHIYALNPCAEFWEDLVTERERGVHRPTRSEARIGSLQGLEDLEVRLEAEAGDLYQLCLEGPEALRRWGRPGRENIRLLNEVSGCDFQSAFELPAEKTLLEKIQADILLFQEPSEARGAHPDDSVRFIAAPSPRREAEIVATEIWQLMAAYEKTDAPLGFSDIAVIVPSAEQEAYLAHLQAAFEQTHRIPWVQSDGAGSVMRQMLEAAELLLELPTSGMTRAALLRVLSCPAVARRFGDIDPGTWARWCETLGIVRGADRKSWEGTYLDQDALNWDQGFKRLALGAFMADGSELSDSPASYAVHAAADEASAGFFITLCRSLIRDAEDLAIGKMDLGDWVDRLSSYFTKWLEAEDEAAVKALERMRTYLDRLLEGVPEGLETPEIGFAAIRFLALQSLGSLRSEHPVSLTRGVVVSSYTPMRAIPFRVVFLMGLGEGVFPTRDQRSALDLRANLRQPGDVSQTEKEKYLFLETLLSTREHLILSHVAMDELSGEKQDPSGLYKEFRGLVSRYLPDELEPSTNGDPLLESHPLRRFDPVYFPEWFASEAPNGTGLRNYSPVAQSEARALWLRSQLAAGEPFVLPSSLGDLPAPSQTRALLESWLGSPGSGRIKPPEAILRISLSDLRTWLECPLTGAAAVRLGLRREELEDRTLIEDECFESDFLEGWKLQREVVMRVFRKKEDPETVYTELLKKLQARAEAPFGVFAESEKAKNMGLIEAWSTALQAEPGRPEIWRFGARSSAASGVDHAEPALELSVRIDGRVQRVSLTGELRPQWAGSLFLEEGEPPSASGMNKLRKKALQAYLEHVVLTWVDPRHREHAARFIFHKPKKDAFEKTLTFRPMTQEQAREQLESWVHDLLTGNHAVLMPIEAVLNDWPELSRDSILEFVEGELGNGMRTGGFTTLRGPVPEPLRYEPPDDPAGLAQARYGDFLEQVFSSAEVE
mgnify:CR=1 FL=1